MFDLENGCGRLIKLFARVYSAAVALAGLIIGICFAYGSDGLIGIVIILSGFAIAIMSLFFMYGFGSVVEDLHAIRSSAATSARYAPARPVAVEEDDDELPSL